MMTLKQAKKKAKMLSEAQGVKWLIFIVPKGAPANQSPANLYNEGRFACCLESEREEYEAGGAYFPDLSDPCFQESTTKTQAKKILVQPYHLQGSENEWFAYDDKLNCVATFTSEADARLFVTSHELLDGLKLASAWIARIDGQHEATQKQLAAFKKLIQKSERIPHDGQEKTPA